ncbi:MAG: putative transport system permease protein [Frankiales bacterium]|nr:putative transport system permease protein [Frankiales bacterium]
MNGPAVRALLRLAGRDAWRHRGRSFLITLTLAFPVAGLVAAATLIHALTVPVATKVSWALGQADAMVGEYDSRFMGPAGEALALQAVNPRLPAGSRSVAYAGGRSRVSSAGQVLRQIDVSDLPYDDPIARGMVHPLQGRAPRAADEVAVSKPFAAAEQLGLGSQITLLDAGDRPLTVVGVAEAPDAIATQRVWLAAGSIPSPDVKPPTVLVRVPAGADLTALTSSGGGNESIETRAMMLTLPTSPIATNRSQVGLTVLVAGLALLEAILMAGAAFAVGARRSQRDLALVGATGGDAGQIQGIVLAGGLVLGLVGGAAGSVIGLGLAEALLPFAPRISGHVYVGTHPRVIELVGAAGLGLLTGVIAAWLPARGAARASILASLSGRRGVVRSSAPLTGLAVATAIFGTLVAAWAGRTSTLGGQQINAVLFGAAVAELGFAGCAPALVGFAGRFAGHLPLTARLSLRDIARHRNRTGPAVAAIMATLSGVVAMGVYVASSNARSAAGYSPQLPPNLVTVQTADATPVSASLLSELKAALPVTGQTSLGQRNGDGVFAQVAQADTSAGVSVAAPELLTALGHPDAAVALTQGKLVLVHKGRSSTATSPVVVQHGDTVTRTVQLPTFTVDDTVYNATGGAFVSAAVASRLGLTGLSPILVLELSRKPTQQQLDAAQAVLLAHQSPGSPSAAYLAVETGRGRDKSLLVPLALLAISTLVTFGVTAISTALSAAESKGDFATLSAVGATPFLRRRLAMGQAGVLALLGGVLGILAGLVPMGAVIAVRSDALTFTIPWQVIALALVGVPLLAALGAGVFTRSRLPLTRRLT